MTNTNCNYIDHVTVFTAVDFYLGDQFMSIRTFGSENYYKVVNVQYNSEINPPRKCVHTTKYPNPVQR